MDIVDETAPSGAKQARFARTHPACAVRQEPVPSKRADYRSPTVGGVDAVAGVAFQFEESEEL